MSAVELGVTPESSVASKKLLQTRAGLKMITAVLTLMMIVTGVFGYKLLSSPSSYVESFPVQTEGIVVGGTAAGVKGKLPYGSLPVELPDGHVVNISASEADNLAKGSSVNLWVADVPQGLSWLPTIFVGDDKEVNVDGPSGLSISRSEFRIIDAVGYDDWHVFLILFGVSSLMCASLMALLRSNIKGDPYRSKDKVEADGRADDITCIGIIIVAAFIIMMLMRSFLIRGVTSEGPLWSYWIAPPLVGAGCVIMFVLLSFLFSPEVRKEFEARETTHDK